MPLKKKRKESKIDKDLTLCDDLMKEIGQSEKQSMTWRNKTDTYYRLRMRYKKTKKFPYPGCSNLRLPTIEMYIRKIKAGLVGLYSNIKPRMQVIPQTDADLEKARKIEKFLDWLVDVKMKVLDTLLLVTDKMLERGFCLLKIDWAMKEHTYTEYYDIKDLPVEEALSLYDPSVPEEEVIKYAIQKFNIDTSETVLVDNIENLKKALAKFRAGKDRVKITLKDEVYHAPEISLVDPLYCYVPTDTGVDPQKARFIVHEYFEPYEELKHKGKEGIFEKDAVDNIEYMGSANLDAQKLVKVTEDAKEGIERLNNPSHLVKLWDIYTHRDLDGDDVDEKVRIIIAPDFKQVLYKQRLPYDHQKFPFVRFNTEITSDRWYSPRGIPEHLADISKEIDAQHNQKLDSQTIRNAPMFVFRSGVVNPRLVKFIPGQGIPVPGMTPLQDAIQVMNNNNPNVEYSYEKEEMLLKTVIQEYLGQMDYSLQSMINKRQPRTASEAGMHQQSASQVFSLDATLFTNSLTEMFTQILELCQQYMPEEVFALLSGSEGVEPLHMTRDEIQGKYHLVCRGNDQNTNPTLKAQKAVARLQMLLNPIVMQTGVVNPMNVYNILKRYLQDDGEMAWQELISQPTPPPPPPVDVKVKMDDLTEPEQDQVVQRLGIEPDPQGRILNAEMEDQKDRIETGIEVAKVKNEENKIEATKEKEAKTAKANK